MNKLFLVAILLAVSTLSTQALNITSCPVLVNNTAIFNLCFFTQRVIETPYKESVYDFTLRTSLGTPHTPSCETTAQVWSTLTDSKNECYNISLAPPSLAFVDKDNAKSGLIITYPLNEVDVKKYGRQLVVELACNESIKDVKDAPFAVTRVDAHTIYMEGASQYGCPVLTLGQFYTFLATYQNIFIPVFAALGLLFAFFGLKLFHVTLFLITAIGGTGVSGILFFQFVKFGSQQWILWVIFGACVVVGCFLGYLAVYYEKVGFFSLGAYLGVIGGLLLYNAVLVHVLTGEKNLTYVFYGVLVVCALIGGGIAIWLYKDVIIIATGIIGSYLTVRAISVLIGGFPNEILVINKVDTLNFYAYLYLAVIAVLAFAGMYYQFSVKRKKEEEEDESSGLKVYKRA